MQTIKFIGTVYTGQGCGKFFVEIPWVMQQLKELTGVTPYLGTLNLRLTIESTEQRAHLTPQNGLLIKPEKGYLPGYLYKARIFDTECYAVLPDVPRYPKDLLEIIATENLRNKFNIKDGDTIPVIVMF
ncbi:MAG: CTP-dependent riboflavin kinase [Candidatus Bathyarchaeota archaeon]|nr:CTP-dependent riboflavin kinase [Candidatus Termiticorpusculum sp.]